MDAGAFSNEKVLAAAKGIRFFLVDGTKAVHPIQKEYHVSGYPALVMCNPRGRAVDQVGMVDADTLVQRFQTLTKEHTLTFPWEKKLEEAMRKGKEGKKPVLAWFPDDKKTSMVMSMAFYEEEVYDLMKDCVLLECPFERKSETAKTIGVSKGGVLVLLDPGAEKPHKPVKRFRKVKSAKKFSKTLGKVLKELRLEMRVRRT